MWKCQIYKHSQTAAFHTEALYVHVQTGDKQVFTLFLNNNVQSWKVLENVPNVTTCPGTFFEIFSTFTVRLLCV